MEIKNELATSQIVLLLVSSTEYNDVIIDVAKQLSEKSVCYVTLNKTFLAIKGNLRKKGINMKNTVFIDCISKTFKQIQKATDECYFVSSPAALTEMSLVISKFLKRNFEYIIFDSLTNLLIYQRRAPVAKFLSSIINKIKASETKAIFYAVSVKEQEELIKECCMFADKVIESDKK